MHQITWKALSRYINAGHGQGTYDDYRPLICIKRKNASQRGNQVADALPGRNRGSHFFNTLTWHVALLASYLGADDIREGYPLWPQPHLHPLAGYDKSSTKECMGLIQVAQRSGLEYAFDRGQGLLGVVCIPLMFTLLEGEQRRLAGIAVKTSDDGSDLTAEWLLQAACMTNYGAHFKVVGRDFIGEHTVGNLLFLSSGARVPEALQDAALQATFVERFVDGAANNSVDAGIRYAAEALSLDASAANLLWRHLVWRRVIAIDITEPLRMRQPLEVGGQALAQALADELFGTRAHAMQRELGT